MKTNLFLFLPILCLLVSCASKEGNTNESSAAATETTALAPNSITPVQKLTKDPRTLGEKKSAEAIAIDENIKAINEKQDGLCGFWVGAFGKNKINIAIANVTETFATGHSVCAGNYREIKGPVKKLSKTEYEFIMNEPGDDKYDGVFTFKIDQATRKLSGTWKPNKPTTSPKTYTLERKFFKFDPTLGDYGYASTELLTDEKLMNMLPEELTYMRNEIYARHGYSFQNMDIRRKFEAKDWYIPMNIDIRTQLSDIEAANIDKLIYYEKYQEDYYDGYGR